MGAWLNNLVGPTWMARAVGVSFLLMAAWILVPDKIDDLLSSHRQDQELSDTLVEMGCAYDPPEGDRAWLQAVRDYIQASDHA